MMCANDGQTLHESLAICGDSCYNELNVNRGTEHGAYGTSAHQDLPVLRDGFWRIPGRTRSVKRIKGGEKMSKKTIEMIREAEVNADALRADAVRRAAEMQAQAEADGKRLCDETEKNTAVELKKMITEMQSKADELKKRSDAQTEADADTLRAEAEKKKRGAVKYILRGIMG